MTKLENVPQNLLVHAAFVRKLARSLLFDPNEAADLEQRTWHRALERPPRRSGDPRAWLATVARNFARRGLRDDARRRERERARARGEALPSHEAALAREEMLQRVVDAVRGLAEPYRSTVLLRYYEDLTPKAIAGRQGISVETVHTRLQRAHSQLRSTLDKQGDDWRAAMALALVPAATTPGLAAAAVLAVAGLGAIAAWKWIGSSRSPADPVLRSSALAMEPSRTELEPVLGVREAIAGAPEPIAAVSDPTGRLRIRVLEGPSHAKVESFSVVVHGGVRVDEDGRAVYEHGYWTQGTQDGDLPMDVVVTDPRGKRLHVALSIPRLEPLPQPEQDVVLLPGATLDVVLAIPERGVVRGQVVDERGAPLASALVFFGPETRARGDEPFRPLRFERIEDGARSGPDGWFELKGEGAEITVLHESRSCATVTTASASRIVLAPRSSIRGRAVDADGQPIPGARLRLDDRKRGVDTTTDEQGLFRFDGVEAGAHAIWQSETRNLLVAMHVASDRPVEVEVRLAEPGRFELELPDLAPEERAALEGLVVGFDEIFSLCAVEKGVVEGAPRPGRYWLATRQGIAAPFTVAAGSERAEVRVGSATLVLRAATRGAVQAVPADADPFLRLAAARAYVPVGPGIEARLRLHPGRYLLVGEAGAVLREVDVPAGESSVALE